MLWQDYVQSPRCAFVYVTNQRVMEGRKFSCQSKGGLDQRRFGFKRKVLVSFPVRFLSIMNRLSISLKV